MGTRGAAASESQAPRPVAKRRCRSKAKPEAKRLNILVTGFSDWRDTADNVWRCRDNPSSRLLVGESCAAPPLERRGALVRALSAALPDCSFNFQVLATTWGTANGLDYSGYDLVLHIGLGVYDSTSRLVLERGVYNMRNGKPDAARDCRSGALVEGAGSTLAFDLMAGRLQELVSSAALPHSFELVVKPARPKNTFICNETHHRALSAVAAGAASGGATPGPAAAYFLRAPAGPNPRVLPPNAPRHHTCSSKPRPASADIPHPADDDPEYQRLGGAVAALLQRMVELESSRPG